jgi:molybdopterin-guanine dinucleotide biosynthesis protein A
MPLSALILAAGQSKRMGRDKAWLEIEGEPLIARALRTVRQLDPCEIFISGRPDTDYSSLGVPVLLDLEPGLGPIAGIEQGLHAATSPLVLALAVDLPCMTASFLRKLLARCSRLIGAVPSLNHRLEPLAAIYPKRCHAIARDCLLNSRLSAREFSTACLRARALKRFKVAPADEHCFANWNSPPDLTSFLPAIV